MFLERIKIIIYSKPIICFLFKLWELLKDKYREYKYNLLYTFVISFVLDLLFAIALASLSYVIDFRIKDFQLFPKAVEPAELIENYSQLLVTILSIYFATISIIVSTKFSSYRKDIINLIITEKYSKIFSHIISISTVFCLLASSLFPPQTFTLLLATLLTISIVVSLFPFGIHLFSLFDLINLLNEVLIKKSTKEIYHLSYKTSLKKSSQTNRNNVNIFIEQFSLISKDIISRDHSTISSIDQGLSYLFCYYLDNKNRISHQSPWFPDYQERENPLIQDELHRTLQIRKIKKDYYWLENCIYRLIKNHTKELLHQRDFIQLEVEIFLLNKRLISISHILDLALFNKECSHYTLLINHLIKSSNRKDYFHILTLTTNLVATLTNGLIEILKLLVFHDKKTLGNYNNSRIIKKELHNFPFAISKEIENIKQQLGVEKNLEGFYISCNKVTNKKIHKLFENEYLKVSKNIERNFQPRISSIIDILISKGFYEIAIACANILLKKEELLKILYEQGNECYHNLILEKQELSPPFNIENLLPPDHFNNILNSAQIQNFLINNQKNSFIIDDLYPLLLRKCVFFLEKNDRDNFIQIYKPLTTITINKILLINKKETARNKDSDSEEITNTIMLDISSLIGLAMLYFRKDNFINPVLISYLIETLNRMNLKSFFDKRIFELLNKESIELLKYPKSSLYSSWKYIFIKSCGVTSIFSSPVYTHPYIRDPLILDFLTNFYDLSDVFLVTYPFPDQIEDMIPLSFRAENLKKATLEDKK